MVNPGYTHTVNETIAKTIAQQEAKIQTYTYLKTKNLPIPPDLQRDMQSFDFDSLVYASGYQSGWKGNSYWSPAEYRDLPMWKMGYDDGYGDRHVEDS